MRAGVGRDPTSGNPVGISGGVTAGVFTLTDLTSAGGIVLGSLGVGQSATLSLTCEVN